MINDILKYAGLYCKLAQHKLKMLEDQTQNTSSELCGECGGACCNSLPGVTHPRQWGDSESEMEKNILEAVKSRNYAIDRWEGDIKGKNELPYIYYIRPATIRGNHPIDTPWGSDTCKLLSDKGCKLEHEHRPTECQSLKPQKIDGKLSCQSVGLNKSTLVIEWRKYVDMMSRIIKKLRAE